MWGAKKRAAAGPAPRPPVRVPPVTEGPTAQGSPVPRLRPWGQPGPAPALRSPGGPVPRLRGRRQLRRALHFLGAAAGSPTRSAPQAARPASPRLPAPDAQSGRRGGRGGRGGGRPGAWSRRVPGLALRLQPRPSAARDARLPPRRPRALPAPAPLAPARPPSLPPGPGPSPGLALRARPAALLRRADRCGRRRAAGTAGCCRARWAAGSALARCAASGPGRSSGAAPSPASAAWRRRGPAPGPAPGPGAAPSKAAGAAGSEARPRLGARPLGRRPGPGWRVGGCSWPAPPAPNPAPRLSFSLPSIAWEQEGGGGASRRLREDNLWKLPGGLVKKHLLQLQRMIVLCVYPPVQMGMSSHINKGNYYCVLAVPERAKRISK